MNYCIRAAVILAALSLGTACGHAAGTDLPPAELPLTLETTGGVAGIQTTLTVDTTGVWTFTDHKDAVQDSTGQLSADQLSTLRQLLADPALVNVPAEKKGRCADFLLYSLTAQHRTIRTGQCGEAAPAVRALISYLRKATISR